MDFSYIFGNTRMETAWEMLLVMTMEKLNLSDPGP